MAERSLNNVIHYVILVVLIIGIIYVRLSGIYNPVYYSVEVCGQVVTVGKTNQMAWEKDYEYLKENPRGNMGMNNGIFPFVDLGDLNGTIG